MKGLNVMGSFKELFIKVVFNFLNDFQSKRKEIVLNKDKYFLELDLSSKIAISRAKETIDIIFKVLGM